MSASQADRFERFHRANPHVFSELLRLATTLHIRGIARGSIAQLFEVLRYDTRLRTGGNPFKLDNVFRAYYARLLMCYDTDLDGFFELRVQTEAQYAPDLIKLGLVPRPPAWF